MDNFKFDFFKNEFQAFWSVRFKFHFQNLTKKFSTRFFSLYRGILELKNDTGILRKNGSFSNKTCCGLTALILKTKIYFCHYNFVNKQINQKFLVSFFRVGCSQYVQPKIFQKMFAVLEMELQIYVHLLKMSQYNVTPFKNKIYR